MKRTLKISLLLLIVFFIVIFFMPTKIFAATEIGTMDELRKAIEIDKVSEIKLTSSFEISGQSSLTSRETILAITNSIIIDGNGQTLTSSTLRSMFDIYNITGTDIEVTFKNIILKNSDYEARCIDTRDDGEGNITLNLDGVVLDTTNASGGNPQPLTNGGNYTGKNIFNLVNTTINAGKAGYCVTAFNQVELNITGSNLTGYAALYMQGIYNYYGQPNNAAGTSGSVINIDSSILVGENNNEGSTDVFATINFEDTGITVNVKNNSIIKATGKGKSAIVSETLNNGVDLNKGNNINVSNSSVINTSKPFNGEEEPSFSNLSSSKSSMKFDTGVSSNLTIPNTYLPEGTTVEKDASGNNIVVVKTYNINVDKVTNGTVTVDKSKAAEGEMVTLTVKPAEGYEIDKIIVDGLSQGTAIENKKFTMPNNDVTVKVTFKEKKAEITEPVGSTSSPAQDTNSNLTVQVNQDNTPKTGVIDLSLYIAAIIGTSAALGIIIIKKNSK